MWQDSRRSESDSNTHTVQVLEGSTAFIRSGQSLPVPSRQVVRSVVNVQGMATTVSGRLGEWMEIGGISQQRSSEQATLLGRGSGSVAQSRRVLVKVEELRGE